MKTLLSLTYFYLIAFAREKFSVQSSSSNKFVYVQDWVKSIDDLKKFDLSKNFNQIFVTVNDTGSTDEKIIKNVGHNSSSIAHNDTNDNVVNLSTPVHRNNSNKSTNEGIQLSSKSNNDIDKNICTEKNERYPIFGSCDSYIECQNGKEIRKQCPNGLRYKMNVQLNMDPCRYPADVQCAPGSTLQPPKATEVCPNQFGYFKTVDRYNCSSFRICDHGIGLDYVCPNGLAFNSVTSRCDLPDRVPECDVEALLGFRCPDVPNSSNTNISRTYRSPADCRKYFLCINGKPRRFECDEYFGFNEITRTCVPADEISQCSDEQQRIASLFVRRKSDGGYLIRNFDKEYLNTRAVALRFVPKVNSRPKIIHSE